MVTIEERLKEYILQRYNSIREFSIAIDMSNSTLDSILKRGIGNASVTNIVKICKKLNISADALADGEIVPITSYKKPKEIMIEVEDILADVKFQLENIDGLTFEGKPATKENINTIVQALNIGEEIAKKSLTKGITKT